jgi:enoyl-CoA hydratase/carnithine racemase
MPDDNVLLERQGPVAVVRLNRPEKMNAVTWAMIQRMDEIIAEIKRDPAIRAAVLTGEGRAFSAGTDLQELSAGRPASGINFGRSHFADAAPWDWTSIAKPTIAAVNGAAAGLGAEMALQCDFRIASELARFSWIFPHRGLVPDTGAGTWLLSRVVGLQRAAEILYSGEFIDAQKALQIGLVVEVVPPERLLPAALEWAERMTTGSPLAIVEIKRLLYQGLARPAVEHLMDNSLVMERMFRSDDHREGVAAFLEKRAPNWGGQQAQR